MSTIRKLVMPICGAIVGISGMMLALMPTALLANSPGHSPESNTHYAADSLSSSPVSLDDFPWS